MSAVVAVQVDDAVAHKFAQDDKNGKHNVFHRYNEPQHLPTVEVDSLKQMVSNKN